MRRATRIPLAAVVIGGAAILGACASKTPKEPGKIHYVGVREGANPASVATLRVGSFVSIHSIGDVACDLVADVWTAKWMTVIVKPGTHAVTWSYRDANYRTKKSTTQIAVAAGKQYIFRFDCGISRGVLVFEEFAGLPAEAPAAGK